MFYQHILGQNIAKKLDEALASYQEDSEQDKGIEVYEVHSVQTRGKLEAVINRTCKINYINLM